MDFISYANSVGEATSTLNQVNNLRELKIQAKEQKGQAFSTLEELTPIVGTQSLKTGIDFLINRYGSPMLKDTIKGLGLDEDSASKLLSGDFEGFAKSVGEEQLKNIGSVQDLSELGSVESIKNKLNDLAPIDDAEQTLKSSISQNGDMYSDLAAQSEQELNSLTNFGFKSLFTVPKDIEMTDFSTDLQPASSIAPETSDFLAGSLTKITTGVSDSIGGNIADTLSNIAKPATEAISGAAEATAGAEAGEVAAEATAGALEAVSSALGPVGLVAGLVGAIVSAFKGAKEAKELKQEETIAQSLNPASQFI